jgi:hypothetical protein
LRHLDLIREPPVVSLLIISQIAAVVAYYGIQCRLSIRRRHAFALKRCPLLPQRSTSISDRRHGAGRLDVGDVPGEVKDAITTEPDSFKNAKLRVPRRRKNLIGSVGGFGGNGHNRRSDDSLHRLLPNQNPAMLVNSSDAKRSARYVVKDKIEPMWSIMVLGNGLKGGSNARKEI